MSVLHSQKSSPEFTVVSWPRSWPKRTQGRSSVVHRRLDPRRLGLGFIVILGLLVSLPRAQAESVRALVVKSASNTGSDTRSETRLNPIVKGRALSRKGLPVETTFALRQALNELNSGDFVIISGELLDLNRNKKPDHIRVQGIESVGLQRLLGVWRTANWDVFNFESFEKLTLYKYHRTGRSAREMRLSHLKDMSYSLSPDRGSVYSIFMVEAPHPQLGRAGQVFVGSLELQTQGNTPVLQLSLIDSKTGGVSEVLSLLQVAE
jgi:hypothetical protein